MPLMPAAAAYSRKLLAARKAVLLPHPALSVMELTRAVFRPVLHPVLLGVALHPLTATVLLVSGHRGGTVLARCIVDAPRDAPPTAAPSPLPPTPQRQNHAIAAVVAALQRFFPISHIALLEPVPLTSDTRHQRDTLATVLQPSGCSIVPTTHAHAVPDGLPATLYHTLRARLPERARCSAHMVAIYQPFPPIPAAPPSDPRRPHTAVTIRAPLRVRVAQQTVTGIALPHAPSAPLHLRLPVAATSAGVTWETHRFAADTLLRAWPWEPVVLVPVAGRLPATARPDEA
jgi:hypothetical protein